MMKTVWNVIGLLHVAGGLYQYLLKGNAAEGAFSMAFAAVLILIAAHWYPQTAPTDPTTKE